MQLHPDLLIDIITLSDDETLYHLSLLPISHEVRFQCWTELYNRSTPAAKFYQNRHLMYVLMHHQEPNVRNNMLRLATRTNFVAKRLQEGTFADRGGREALYFGLVAHQQNTIAARMHLLNWFHSASGLYLISFYCLTPFDDARDKIFNKLMQSPHPVHVGVLLPFLMPHHLEQVRNAKHLKEIQEFISIFSTSKKLKRQARALEYCGTPDTPPAVDEAMCFLEKAMRPKVWEKRLHAHFTTLDSAPNLNLASRSDFQAVAAYACTQLKPADLIERDWMSVYLTARNWPGFLSSEKQKIIAKIILITEKNIRSYFYVFSRLIQFIDLQNDITSTELDKLYRRAFVYISTCANLTNYADDLPRHALRILSGSRPYREHKIIRNNMFFYLQNLSDGSMGQAIMQEAIDIYRGSSHFQSKRAKLFLYNICEKNYLTQSATGKALVNELTEGIIAHKFASGLRLISRDTQKNFYTFYFKKIIRPYAHRLSATQIQSLNLLITENRINLNTLDLLDLLFSLDGNAVYGAQKVSTARDEIFANLLSSFINSAFDEDLFIALGGAQSLNHLLPMIINYKISISAEVKQQLAKLLLYRKEGRTDDTLEMLPLIQVVFESIDMSVWNSLLTLHNTSKVKSTTEKSGAVIEAYTHCKPTVNIKALAKIFKDEITSSNGYYARVQHGIFAGQPSRPFRELLAMVANIENGHTHWREGIESLIHTAQKMQHPNLIAVFTEYLQESTPSHQSMLMDR